MFLALMVLAWALVVSDVVLLVALVGSVIWAAVRDARRDDACWVAYLAERDQEQDERKAA